VKEINVSELIAPNTTATASNFLFTNHAGIFYNIKLIHFIYKLYDYINNLSWTAPQHPVYDPIVNNRFENYYKLNQPIKINAENVLLIADYFYIMLDVHCNLKKYYNN